MRHFFDSTSFYIKEKLLEEGIPFVLKDKQVYLPFIGYLLSNENERKISPVHLISFLTQKLYWLQYMKMGKCYCIKSCNKIRRYENVCKQVL